MVKEIEEYDVRFNIWKIVELVNPYMWIPMEIGGIVQLDERKVMIFGGCDIDVNSQS